MNQKLFYYLHAVAGQSVWGDRLIYFLAVYWPYGLMIILLLDFLWWPNYRQRLCLFFSLLSAVSSWLVANLAKLAWSYPRPFVWFDQGSELFQVGAWEAWPSGHSAWFAALTTSLFLTKSKWRWWALLSTILIGLARVSAGVHWPVDILSGYLLGIVSANLLWLFTKKILKTPRWSCLFG